MRLSRAFLIITAILIADQTTKFWVKTQMYYGQEIEITNWLSIHFIENRGMAFGMEIPGVWGKLFLSVFRLVAVGGGIWFIIHLIKQKSHWGFVTAAAMILAGAIGNMIDGTFYGIIFSDMYSTGHGNSGFLLGRVVDMIHIKLFYFTIPGWVPGVGGNEYEFFPFIFNIADSAITVGVVIILIFQKVFFKENKQVQTASEEVQNPANV